MDVGASSGQYSLKAAVANVVVAFSNTEAPCYIWNGNSGSGNPSRVALQDICQRSHIRLHYSVLCELKLEQSTDHNGIQSSKM